MTSVMILDPNKGMLHLQGPRGTTPGCPEAKFKRGDVVRVRRKKHLMHLPDRAAIVTVIPPGFSPDWAMADLRGEPRPLLHAVGRSMITYIVGFDGNPKPYLLKERDLLPSNEAPVEIVVEADPTREG